MGAVLVPEDKQEQIKEVVIQWARAEAGQFKVLIADVQAELMGFTARQDSDGEPVGYGYFERVGKDYADKGKLGPQHPCLPDGSG
jgi:hypothetical protein